IYSLNVAKSELAEGRIFRFLQVMHGSLRAETRQGLRRCSSPTQKSQITNELVSDRSVSSEVARRDGSLALGTRAMMISAMTTATVFGILWPSTHPGTCSRGKIDRSRDAVQDDRGVFFSARLEGPATGERRPAS